MTRTQLFVIVWWVRKQHPGNCNTNQEDLDQPVKVILRAAVIVNFHCGFGPFIKPMNPEICEGNYTPEESILKSDSMWAGEGSNENPLESKEDPHSGTCE